MSFYVFFIISFFPFFFFLWTEISNGENSIDWSDTDIFASIDENASTISIITSTSVEGEPDSEYEIDIDFLDYSCKEKLSYRLFNLRGNCIFDIDISQIEKKHKVILSVTDASSGQVTQVYLPLLLTGYNTSFSWKNIEKETEYDWGLHELTLWWKICHDTAPLYNGYTIEIGIDDSWIYGRWNNFKKKYSETLHHIQNTDCLEFSWVIKDSFSVNYETSYKVRIFDKTRRLEWEHDIMFPWADNLYHDEIKEINWKMVKWDYAYNKSQDTVVIRIYVPNIPIKPSNSYTIDIDNRGNIELLYDPEMQYLYTQYIVEHDRDKDDRKYKIEYIIRWSDYQRKEEGDIKLKFDYFKTDFDNVQEEETVERITEKQTKKDSEVVVKQEHSQLETESTLELSPIELAIDKFIQRQRLKFSDSQDLKDNLILTTQLLTNYANDNAKYAEVIEEINSFIMSRVEDM